MKIKDLKFLNKGRLSEEYQQQIVGGGMKCGSKGGAYFIECVTLHGNCKPHYHLCWGNGIGQKMSCEPFAGTIPCSIFNIDACHFNSSKVVENNNLSIYEY